MCRSIDSYIRVVFDDQKVKIKQIDSWIDIVIEYIYIYISKINRTIYFR